MAHIPKFISQDTEEFKEFIDETLELQAQKWPVYNQFVLNKQRTNWYLIQQYAAAGMWPIRPIPCQFPETDEDTTDDEGILDRFLQWIDPTPPPVSPINMEQD